MRRERAVAVDVLAERLDDFLAGHSRSVDDDIWWPLPEHLLGAGGAEPRADFSVGRPLCGACDQRGGICCPPVDQFGNRIFLDYRIGDDGVG